MANRPKPRNLKLLGGTNRPSRDNPSEPKPAIGAPACPEYLDDVAKKLWDVLVPELVRLGVLAKITDQGAIEGYVCSYANAVRAQKVICKKGQVTAGRKRPEVQIAKDSWAEVRRFGAEFGLTASSRTRVTATPMAPTDNTEEVLFGKAK